MQQIEKVQRVLIINLVQQRVTPDEVYTDLEELWSLIETLGNAEVVKIVQQKERPDMRTYIGSGKTEEVSQVVIDEKIDVVIVNALLKPMQTFNLRQAFWKSNNNIIVWDRIDLILEIFSRHAKTLEAKLQIDLARMRHMGSRIYGMGMIMSRQGGGIGTVGIGETNTELMRRHWRDAIHKVSEQLDKLGEERERQLERRRKLGMQTVSIVGYTNAGKTSLFNVLTNKENLVENALFATLDSTVGKLYLHEYQKEIFLSDTIGFIKNLPPKLISAFKSTLMESVHADILLHVIDVTDSSLHDKIKVVESILEELGIGAVKRIYVFNKSDALGEGKKERIEKLREQYHMYQPLFISAKKKEGIEQIEKEIGELLSSS